MNSFWLIFWHHARRRCQMRRWCVSACKFSSLEFTQILLHFSRPGGPKTQVNFKWGDINNKLAVGSESFCMLVREYAASMQSWDVETVQTEGGTTIWTSSDFWRYLLSFCITDSQFWVYDYLKTDYTQGTEILASVLNTVSASDITACCVSWGLRLLTSSD